MDQSSRIPMPEPLSDEYVQKLKDYEKQKQEKLIMLQQQADSKLTKQPEVTASSKQLAMSYREKKSIDSNQNAGERLFNTAFEQQKAELAQKKEQQEKQKKQLQEAQKQNLFVVPRLTKDELKELQEKDKELTFKPQINASDVQHDGTELDFLYQWDRIRKEKIEKMKRTKMEKENAKIPFKPDTQATKAKTEQLLKNKEIEKMPVEDRIFKRAADKLKNYKGVEIKEVQEATFKPQINEKSQNLQRPANIFETLYETGKQKQQEKLLQETQKTDAQNRDLVEQLFMDGIKQFSPGREVVIMDRYERTKQKRLEKLATERFEEKMQHEVVLNPKSRVLAEQRRKRIEDGSFQSVRRSVIPVHEVESVVCKGTRQILKDKENNYVPANERLYNLSKIQQQMKPAPVEDDLKDCTFKPNITVRGNGVETTFEERQRKYLERRQQLLQLKEQKDLEQLQEYQKYQFKPNIHEQKSVARILHETSVSAEALKISAKTMNATNDFVQRIKNSRQQKEQQQQKLVPDISKWKIQPTQQKPFKFARAQEKQDVSQDMLDFLNILDVEMELGAKDSRKAPQEISTQIDVKSSVREQANLGALQIQVENEAFTQFHKFASVIVQGQYDQVEYAARRAARQQEVKLFEAE